MQASKHFVGRPAAKKSNNEMLDVSAISTILLMTQSHNLTFVLGISWLALA